MTKSLLETERARQPGASDVDCVRAIAGRVIERLEIVEPPVNVDAVASFLDISSVVRDKGLVEAGCLTCEGGRLHIRVRAQDGLPRQRFTICHECGHTFFPGFDRQTHFRCAPRPEHAASRTPRGASEAEKLERLCDLVASELLLPRRLFDAEASASVFALSSVATLADRYEASLEATARRFVAAQPDSTALIILKVVQKPVQRGSAAAARLRVTSTFTSGSWPFIPAHKSVHANGPFDRALQGELVHEMTTIDDLFKTPLQVEISAEASHYYTEDTLHLRVMALLRRHTS